MQFRIQRSFYARIPAVAILAALLFCPTGLRAGGEDPPHGRPGMGGDVALRGKAGSDGRAGRSGSRGVAAREARDPLVAIEAAIDRWLHPAR